MIFQIHADHGRHIAYNNQEAQSNRDHGWKDVTKEEYYGGIKEINVPRETLEESNEEIPRAVLEDLYTAKFGKAPHHRMADATIKAKIEEE